MDEYLMIGEVVRPQGINGDLKVKPLTNDPYRFERLDSVFTGPAFAPRGMTFLRVREGFVYLRLEGVETREGAEEARGMALYIDRENAVELSEDENFICDLIGCEAVDETGKQYGKLTEVLQPGANDVYVIKQGKKELLVPALKHVVTDVDIANRRITFASERLAEVAVFAD